jgi:hypothetical protein
MICFIVSVLRFKNLNNYYVKMNGDKCYTVTQLIKIVTSFAPYVASPQCCYAHNKKGRPIAKAALKPQTQFYYSLINLVVVALLSDTK